MSATSGKQRWYRDGTGCASSAERRRQCRHLPRGRGGAGSGGARGSTVGKGRRRGATRGSVIGQGRHRLWWCPQVTDLPQGRPPSGGATATASNRLCCRAGQGRPQRCRAIWMGSQGEIERRIGNGGVVGRNARRINKEKMRVGLCFGGGRAAVGPPFQLRVGLGHPTCRGDGPRPARCTGRARFVPGKKSHAFG